MLDGDECAMPRSASRHRCASTIASLELVERAPVSVATA
jgi:hypothetical protein